MNDTIQSLTEKMEAAVQQLNFEEAKRLRDRIYLMRGGASAAEAEAADMSGFERQRPGAMGLGTSQQVVAPPPGWKPPPKPSHMAQGKSRRGNRKPRPK